MSDSGSTIRGMKGQVAIVTGAARGIGLGIARRLATEGCKIVVWDWNLEPLAASGFTPDATFKLDITDYAAVERAAGEVAARFGQIHILVNNAGVNGPVIPTWDYPLEEWHRVLAVDLTGVFHCCRAVVPHMRAKGYGRIVNVASIAGKEGMPGISPYSAAKAGVIGFAKALARELVTSGITVNCLTPGITETELFREMTEAHISGAKSRIPMGRFCTVDEIAAMTAYVASPECSFTTGALFDLSGGRATY
jgi:3-oxoacyl-[acyl-carrier protein] reductase